MDSIIEAIEDWFRGLLVSGIMSNITNTFSALNILNYNIHFVNLVSSMQEISGSSAGCTVHSDSEGVYDLLVLLREEFINSINRYYHKRAALFCDGFHI